MLIDIYKITRVGSYLYETKQYPFSEQFLDEESVDAEEYLQSEMEKLEEKDIDPTARYEWERHDPEASEAMMIDILEHDQTGTALYCVWRAPFTVMDWENGQVLIDDGCGNYIVRDCSDIIDEYIEELTKSTLSSFTSTSYSAQVTGAFECDAKLDEDEKDALAIEASNILAGYLVKEDSGIAIDLLVSHGYSEEDAELSVNMIEELADA